MGVFVAFVKRVLLMVVILDDLLVDMLSFHFSFFIFCFLNNIDCLHFLTLYR